MLRDGVQRLAAGHAGRERVADLPRRKLRVPAGRQVALARRAPLVGEIRERLRPGLEAAVPVALHLRAALDRRAEMLQGLRRLVERFGPLPAERLLGQRHFLDAERAAVRGRSPGLVRRAVPDRRAHGDDRRPVFLRDGRPNRRVDGVEVRVAVLDAQHLPAVRLVAAQDVLGEGLRGRAVERDVVVVVEIHELAELQVPGQRTRLTRDALHQVAVGHQAERPVVDDLVARPVVPGGEKPLGDRHADRVGGALAERARRRLDARRQVRLGVARRPAAPLAEGLEVVERQVVARQVQKAVEQHAAVSGRQDEPVPVGPVRIAGIVLEMALPEHVGHRGGPEGKARMSRVGLLNRVDGKGADRVHAEFVEGFLHRAQWALLVDPDLITPDRRRWAERMKAA